MSYELSKSSDRQQPLDARFASRPEVRERLHQIADMMDKAIEDGASADEAEAMAIEQIQQLGSAVLSDWARAKQASSLSKARQENPSAIRHIKKKVTWFSTYGAIDVEEQLLRLGRRGRELRPFCSQAGVSHHGYSRRLQRVLVDFGAESAFGPAARRVREHYGISVPVSKVRQATLKHARVIGMAAANAQAGPAAKILLTQMDGSMVPIVQPGSGRDQRKGKKLLWREARLCCARSADAAQALYGATLGSVEVAGWTWQQTARLAGCAAATRVHGVGDGARWILNTFAQEFGAQGRYTIDFYHVSEYLAAAAHPVARPGKQTAWRRRQQARLLENKVSAVLRALEKCLEPKSAPEAPVRAAFDYIQERRDCMDYAGARARDLPIGSGEIESGHRHVIQQRLKLSGGWWTERNMESMLQLRTARANGWWDSYWAKLPN